MKLKKCFKKTGLAAGQMGRDQEGPCCLSVFSGKKQNLFFFFLSETPKFFNVGSNWGKKFKHCGPNTACRPHYLQPLI